MGEKNFDDIIFIFKKRYNQIPFLLLTTYNLLCHLMFTYILLWREMERWTNLVNTRSISVNYRVYSMKDVTFTLIRYGNFKRLLHETRINDEY